MNKMAAPQPGAATLLDPTIEFLRKYPPFNEMEGATLEYLAAHVKLAYYPKGSLVVGPESGVVRTFYVIQRGTVRATVLVDKKGVGLAFGPGEVFPLAAVMNARATTSRYTAAEDTFCYETDAATVEELARRSREFQRFTTRFLDSLLRQCAARLRNAYSEETLAQHSMHRTLGEVVRGNPVTCLPGTPLRDALATMQRNKRGSIIVASADDVATGIFTERDLLAQTVAGRVDLGTPIDEFMTPNPVGMPSTALLSDAALAMARRGIRHILVIDGGKLKGLVSERDLFALQRLSMREVTHSIEVAVDLVGLQAAAAEIRSLARSMLAQGIAAEQLTQLISALNDRLTQRVLDLERDHHDLTGVRFCWMALGSEGRHEQTFSSDQDNAILFAASGGDADALRARLLPFANAVNQTLDACGFPLCKGNIMAGNPQWCLSEGEWREQFGDWVRNPVPEALLNATIFFDFRGMWGDLSLADTLAKWLHAETSDNQRFLRMMAANALQSEPPLRFFGDFRTSGEKDERGTIDLKAQGTRIFIDVARIYALAQGAAHQNTAARLRITGTALRIRPDEIEAKVHAFYFLLLLRLRHQHLEAIHGSNPNRIRPEDLNELESRILKEAFRQARSLQRRLRLDYRL